MIKVIGVRFRTAGKIYFFDPLNFEIKRGDHVIVETARGIEYGTVVSGIREVEEDKVIQPLKAVIRIATERDYEQETANKIKEKEAYKICLEKIHKHGLEMKLIDAEYTFDNNKVLFYFTADGRIDFRELVKDLASVFKTRIELRQIGVRDETKIMGGIGICGRPLCCHSYLPDFVPVSIKMAKEQNLSLNPTKISGVCGRLMCCLKNEEETYEELNRRLPNIGDYVTTEEGIKGEVQSVNVLRQLVKVIVDINDEKEIREYEVDKLSFKKKQGKKDNVELSKEELQELERLEKEELQDNMQELEKRRTEKKSEGHHENRSDRRGEGCQENRSDRRGEGYPNNRQDRRIEGHQNNRQERRSESYQENRQDRRNEGNQENRQDRRNEGYQENRQDRRSEGYQENRQDRTSEGNQENRQDRRNEGYQENNQDQRSESYQENCQEQRSENYQENRQNRRIEGNQENRRDRRNERYQENRQDRSGQRYQDNHQDRRGEGRQDNRQNNRQNYRYNNQDDRQEHRQDNRQEGRRDRRGEHRQGRRYDGKPRRDRQDDRVGRNTQNYDNQSEK